MKHSIKSIFAIIAFVFTVQTNSFSQIEFCAVPIEDNGMIELQVKTANFNQISSFQFGVAWSINKFELVSIENFNPDLAGYDETKFSPVFENVPEQINLVRTLWYDPSLNSATLEDGSVLFSVILEPIVTDPSESYGIVADNQFPIEVIDVDFMEIDVVLDNCEGISTFNINTSTKDLTEQLSFTLQPNPVMTTLDVTFERSVSGLVKIFNLKGELITTKNHNSKNSVTLDLSKLNSGLYLFKFEDHESKTTTTRFIVKE